MAYKENGYTYVDCNFIDSNTLVINEDAEKGSRINLKKVLNFDRSVLEESLRKAEEEIKEGKDVKYNKLLEEREKNVQERISLAESKKENELNRQFNNIKNKQEEEFKKSLEDKQKELDKAIAQNNELKVKNAQLTKNEESIKANFENELLKKFESEKEKIQQNNENLLKEKQEDLNKKNEDLSQAQGEIKLLKEQVEYYKDFKLKLSTKLLGESLEEHCKIEFDKLRATAFKNDFFGKDNKVSDESSSKGDFIYRAYDESDVNKECEFLSIMFEMKNQNDTTATKKTNESFLNELNKDRIEKHCEYAILVSVLEEKNELYNQGIVDVSHLFPKMYVIRPQFFIQMISLLRNAALNNLNDKKLLKIEQQKQIDVTNFENKLIEFKEGWGLHCKHANNNFDKAIEEIQKSIEALQKTKKALETAKKQMSFADKKVIDELDIRKLGKNSPSLLRLLDETESDTKEN